MDRKINILHLIATNFLGGPEKQIIEHLRRLDRNIFNPIAASFFENGAPNEFIEKAKEENIDSISIPMSHPFDIRSLYNLRNIIKNEKVDLLCAHGYKSCIIGLLAAKAKGIPAVAFSRGYTAENFKILFYQWLERKFLGRFTGVIAVSKAQLNLLTSFYKLNFKKTWVVHNAALLSDQNYPPVSEDKKNAILKSLELPTDARIIVSAGRLSPEKGQRFLIESISLIKNLGGNIFFVFCGDGMCLPELQRLSKNLCVDDKIRFAGFRKDISDIFCIMEFLVLPSLSEGLPNVILEAFSFKKPVVATSVGGVPEVIDDKINGFLCYPGDARSLSNAISEAINHQDLLPQMGNSGYLKVKENFSSISQNNNLENIYKEVLNTSS